MNNFLGIPPEQALTSPDVVGVGAHVLSAHFEKESVGDRNEAIGTAKLQVDGKTVAEGPWRTQPGHFALCGEGLCVGRDSADPVSKEYPSGFPFTGGAIRRSRSSPATTTTKTSSSRRPPCWLASDASLRAARYWRIMATCMRCSSVM